jgi:hypothetical protein
MNDANDNSPVTRHRATETGCGHWSPIVLPVSNAGSDAETAPSPPMLSEAPAEISPEDKG